MATPRHLDCTGLACPQPVIQTKDTLLEMTESELLVVVDNEAASSNVSRYAESQGHRVSVTEQSGGIFHIHIAKKEGEPLNAPEPPIECPVPDTRTLAVYIGSEFMGKGDDELGAILMGAYFETLSHFAREISHVILVNSAVKLAVKGSAVLDHLQELEKTGIEVLACGTCLNFFDLKEKLRVGTVSNMFTILDILAKSSKTLSP